MVVTQSIGYYIYLVRSRSVGKIMDCKADLMAANELINIHEMSERSSVSASTLRYYEKLGLITSERGRSGSHRRYSEATLHRITYITLAQRAGFSLEEIADQLAILPNIHPLPPKVWEPLRKKWEQRIDQTIVELKQLKIDLKRCARDASR
jgi:MerR family redox-sensitive transcriptional activator SoxR